MKTFPATRLRQATDQCLRHELDYAETGDPSALLAAAACHPTAGRPEVALSRLDDLAERNDLPVWLEFRIRTMRSEIVAYLQDPPAPG